MWKTAAFKTIVKNHFDLNTSSNDNIYTIISIGDSHDEYTAAAETKQMISTMNRLNRNNNIVRCHRIKLEDQPTIKVMLKQIASLIDDVDVFKTEQGSMRIQYGQEHDAKQSDTKRNWESPLCCSTAIPEPICSLKVPYTGSQIPPSFLVGK